MIIKNLKYPEDKLCHPDQLYPEYPFPGISRENKVYSGVRELFLKLGMDKENYDTLIWNPLKGIVKPGDTVVIKPNFVLSKHPDGKDIYSVITHPSVIRAVLDYVYIALKGSGKIIIAEAPQYNCNFAELLRVTDLQGIVDYINDYGSVDVEIKDLRRYWSKTRHFPSCLKGLPGDSGILVSYGDDSKFFNHRKIENIYGAVYDRKELQRYNNIHWHEYVISKTVIESDVIISLPKLKTHKKAGVTLNFKNMFGCIVNKNCIPHYTLGSPLQGGDQYPDDLSSKDKLIIRFTRWCYDRFLSQGRIMYELIHRFIYGLLYLKIFQWFGLRLSKRARVFDTGNWSGNDTVWRACIDIVKGILFTNKRGDFVKRRRRCFSIIDGVVAGEGNGPLNPEPKLSGVIIGGKDFFKVDCEAVGFMGFDPCEIKQYSEYGKIGKVEINKDKFKPHEGWNL